jgi:hypothetical protein
MSQDLNELLGPSGRGDHRTGDTITFTEGAQTFTGEIIHVEAPGQTVTGKHHPTTYHTDCGDGWPHLVYASQIIQEK